ncbi:MAG: hypothetical protein MUF27_04235 [Acidobacteria bacterium]|nr:hypothetical protein [Acidobacteriota bacterium]
MSGAGGEAIRVRDPYPGLRDVVVTGLGALGAFGAGREALAAGLRSGAPRLSPVERPPGYHRSHSARRAALVTERDFARWIPPAAARRMGLPSRFAVAASMMALEDGGLPRAQVTPELAARGAVFLGTAFGSALFSEQLLGEIFRDPEQASPFRFAESVANAPTAQVALALGITGANVTLTLREASPLAAVAGAAREIGLGRADWALAGAVEELSPLLHAALDRFRALARPHGAQPEAARPLDARRDGFVAAEGATVLLLESAERAAARGARVLARVRGAFQATDPSAPAASWGCGVDELAEALAAGLARHRVLPEEIGLVVSGASGARRGDLLEGQVLRAGWEGAPLPPVTAPKGATGEYGGFLAGAAVLAVESGLVAAPRWFEEEDEGVGIVPVDALDAPPAQTVLVSTLAAAGAAAWLLLDPA